MEKSDLPPSYSESVQETQKIENTAHIEQSGTPTISSTQTAQGNHPSYGSIPTIVRNGDIRDICIACHVGEVKSEYSCLGVCCAIVFFPIGILFCLLTKEKRCSNCDTIQ